MELEESHLVKMLGVSRTPVREALIRLGSEGLVTLMPNQSARVAPLDVGNLRQFFEALDLCQRVLTRLAAARRSDAHLAAIHHHMTAFETAAAKRDADAMIDANQCFHALIGEAGGNVYLARTYDRLVLEGLRIARVCFAYDTDPKDPLAKHLEHTVSDHRDLYNAISTSDTEAAEAIAGKHSELFRRRVAHNLTEIGLNTGRVRLAG